MQLLLTVTTIIYMDITFDPTKNKTNIAKHGVSLALAAQLDWSGRVVLRGRPTRLQ
ncbi:putative pANL56 [Burkholderia pseudomallei MSHR1357]|nr:putative pANL56 [Burkholderia pseudomallei MSHR1357]